MKITMNFYIGAGSEVRQGPGADSKKEALGTRSPTSPRVHEFDLCSSPGGESCCQTEKDSGAQEVPAEGGQEVPAEGSKLKNINKVSLDDLIKMKVKQIGPVMAQRIIDNRPYSCLNKLLDVDGIGETRLKELKKHFFAEMERD